MTPVELGMLVGLAAACMVAIIVGFAIVVGFQLLCWVAAARLVARLERYSTPQRRPAGKREAAKDGRVAAG